MEFCERTEVNAWISFCVECVFIEAGMFPFQMSFVFDYFLYYCPFPFHPDSAIPQPVIFHDSHFLGLKTQFIKVFRFSLHSDLCLQPSYSCCLSSYLSSLHFPTCVTFFSFSAFSIEHRAWHIGCIK